MEVNLSGIWKSCYRYGPGKTGQHLLVLSHHGSEVEAETADSADGSPVTMQLACNGRVLSGTWQERTSEDGPYQGKVFYGMIQLILKSDGYRMVGRWLGHNTTQTRINTGLWILRREVNLHVPPMLLR